MSELAIIIPHLNDASRLYRCLDALAPQVCRGVEVIIVDNGSAAPLDRLETDYPWALLAIERRAGAGLARNLGVFLTDAPKLAFLDCDCVPGSDWVAVAMGVQVDGRVIGGRVETFHEGQGPRTGAQVFEQVFAFDIARYVARLGFCGSGNMVTSRAVFEAVGPFRANVSEDMEWCLRAGAAGVRVEYEPILRASHPTRSDWAALRRKWRRLAAERFLTDAVSLPGRVRWLFRAVFTMASIMRDGPKVMFTNRISGLRDRVFCLGTLLRIRVLRAMWMSGQALTGRP
ncbi:glycosyltransferase family 2 protein [uncultured Litoreibacter sp.]|uniref:glycosyltransferase family 2 protein n=1 Tax=uncultured Litoreibacter sp. TaxID=1392394 RepID=UPI00262574DA|nr:glycosyltransferase family 2 protein [uncultured Litoreibacter sp.]